MRIFQNSRSNLSILGARRVTGDKGQTEDPQILGATVIDSPFSSLVHKMLQVPCFFPRTLQNQPSVSTDIFNVSFWHVSIDKDRQEVTPISDAITSAFETKILYELFISRTHVKFPITQMISTQ